MNMINRTSFPPLINILVFICMGLTNRHAHAVNVDQIDAGYDRFIVPVPLDRGASIQIEVVLPPKGVPKALVIVVPGTGGVSDPYFDPELAKPLYSPDSRGGLTGKLISAGYAAAFYNQRGYAPLRDCIAGDDLTQRTASMVARCVDKKIRPTVTLSTITSDTEKVFSALKNNRRTQSLPRLALAYSEGMHHVSLLAGRLDIDPVGIVGVGGSLESMAATMKFQLGREFYIGLAESAFQHCPEKTLELKRLLACSEVPVFPKMEGNVAEMVGGNLMTKSDLQLRRKFWAQFYQTAAATFANPPDGATMNGNFGQFIAASNWSARYYTEWFSADKSSLQQLDGYRGKVMYLFGALDFLVQVPKTGSCPQSSKMLKNCDVIVMPGVGHGLENETMLPPENSLDQILLALDKVGNFEKDNSVVSGK